MTQRLLTRWFLTSKERGNPSTRLDARHLGGAPWTEGNMVRPLIHGATYFAELHRRVSQMRDGDLLMFVDWRGDPDERLTGSPDTEVGKVFADAARRGVDVRGLVWRSHWDRLAFSAGENRRLGDEINDAGGQCLLDMRVRTGGSHHQKFVVLRHGSRPALDIAFLGGIDLCHGRRDDASHAGDPQPQALAAEYGPRPPRHDVQLAIGGPAAAFRQILVASNGSSLVRSPIWTTALLGLGEALDDDNVGQLGELVRAEQQFAGAIAATHNHPGLLHDHTVDVDWQITNAKRSDPTDHHACEVHGGLFVGEGETPVSYTHLRA